MDTPVYCMVGNKIDRTIAVVTERCPIPSTSRLSKSFLPINEINIYYMVERWMFSAGVETYIDVIQLDRMIKGFSLKTVLHACEG